MNKTRTKVGILTLTLLILGAVFLIGFARGMTQLNIYILAGIVIMLAVVVAVIFAVIFAARNKKRTEEQEQSAQIIPAPITISEPKKHNTCYWCGVPIEKDQRFCPECGETILRCSVCKLPISFGEEIGKCSLCETKGHLVHLQEWVKTNGKCPHCLQQIPLEGIVKIVEEKRMKLSY